MPNAASLFSSVKLPSALVQQARESAQPKRRSVASQIEYRATLGCIADETCLTVQKARKAFARYEARQRGGALEESMDAIESRSVDAETANRQVQAVRSTLGADR